MKCYYVFHSQNLRFNRKFMEDVTKEIETQNRNLKNWRMCFPICNGVFKKHTLGKRYLRANHKTFVNTESWLGQNLEIASLKTDVMKVNTYLKNKKIKSVKHQWKNENQYFSSLNESKITDKNPFGRLLNPFIFNKNRSPVRVILF